MGTSIDILGIGFKFKHSASAKVRYGENAAAVWGDWNLVWESTDDDYQGFAKFIAWKGGGIKEWSFGPLWQGKKPPLYVVYEWSYGSCSGCDTWESEEKSSDDIKKVMATDAVYFTPQEMNEYAANLHKVAKTIHWEDDKNLALSKVESIRIHLRHIGELTFETQGDT